MSEAKVPRDMFNRPIRVGDICVYPVRRKSSMWMNQLLVQKIDEDAAGEIRLSGTKQDGYLIKVTKLDRVCIVGRNNAVPFME